MPKTLTFNGIRKPWLYLLAGRNKPPFAPITRNLLTVPGMPGAHLISTEVEPLVIQQPIGFDAFDDEQALAIKDELAEWLFTEEPAELEFDDEPGRTYYAVVQNTIDDLERFVNWREGTITFLCVDPFSYGPEEKINIITDPMSVVNKGTAEAKPIIEMEAREPVTFAMVSNGEKYNMIGVPAEDDMDVVNQRNLIMQDNGEDLDLWTDSPTEVDPINEQIIDGEIGFDGTGFIAIDYGEGPKGHGPAIIRELDTAIQDYEIETIIDTRTDLKEENFRAELYLYDENMNNLGKIGVRDNSRNHHQRIGLGRAGHYVDGSTRYLIGSSTYKHNDLGKSSMFFLRTTRIGNKFTFYIAHIKNGKHELPYSAQYIDAQGNWLGKLKFVQIYIRSFADRRDPYLVRFNDIKVFERITVEEDQTPYILNRGDIVTFDHEEYEILINGENAMPHKDFGGEFFRLKRGENLISVLPENAFITKLRFKPSYR